MWDASMKVVDKSHAPLKAFPLRKDASDYKLCAGIAQATGGLDPVLALNIGGTADFRCSLVEPAPNSIAGWIE
jgi:hypothetical protein